VYLYEGETYLVDKVDFEQQLAMVHYAPSLPWITRQRDYTDIDGVKTYRTIHVLNSGSVCHFGDVRSK
jgi:hypothetical protein